MNSREDSRPTGVEQDHNAGFDAVMDSLGQLSQQEITELRLQGQAAQLGHDAYALGLEHIQRREWEEAEHCLTIAAHHGVRGARSALEELKVQRAQGVSLPASHRSLAHGVDPSAPGAIYALASTGGWAMGPTPGRQILFGRDCAQVHICVGEDDLHVSRRQGVLEYADGEWRVQNTGRMPIRIGHEFLLSTESVPLRAGYTPIFMGRNEHLLEVFVSDPHETRRTQSDSQPVPWRLTEVERLVVVAFGQRYLRQEPNPRPVASRDVTAMLANLQPEVRWTQKKVVHVMQKLRGRLSQAGVPGLTRAEVGEPVGNTLNHNLIRELVLTGTLVPRDLALLDAA